MSAGPSTEPTPRYAYAVFQGGGARGFAHIPAVKTAEGLGFTFLGVAGTSAGAIVAALLAVGYEADDIYDPHRPDQHLLARYGSPVAILGERAWTRVANLRELFGPSSSKRRKRDLRPAIGAVIDIVTNKGLLDAENFIEALNELIRDRLAANYERERYGSFTNRYVCFKDINRFAPGCRPLKIVTTDLSRNRVVVYSTEDTPDVRVAEAVAASAAVPFLFRPVEVKWIEGDAGRIYVDGGLVSNLPIWVFADERRADVRAFPTLKTIGFGFEEDAPHAKRGPVHLGLLQFMLRLGTAALSTGQSVTGSFIDDLAIVPLRSTLGMLDIDASKEDFQNCYAAAYASARERLEFLFVRRPTTIRGELEKFQAEARDGLIALGAPEGINLRVCAIAPVRSRYGQARIRNFQVLESFGFEDDSDDRLFLDANKNGAPAAFEQRKPVPWLTSNPAGGACPREPMTKYERAWVRPTLRSALFVPVFKNRDDWRREPRARDEPAGVQARIFNDSRGTFDRASRRFRRVALETESETPSDVDSIDRNLARWRDVAEIARSFTSGAPGTADVFSAFRWSPEDPAEAERAAVNVENRLAGLS